MALHFRNPSIADVGRSVVEEKVVVPHQHLNSMHAGGSAFNGMHRPQSVEPHTADNLEKYKLQNKAATTIVLKKSYMISDETTELVQRIVTNTEWHACH